MASRRKKILMGLGIGCGGPILLVVVSIAVFIAWIGQPGELLEPERLLGADTRGFAEWTLTLEDPGTREFVDAVLDRTEANQPHGQTPLPKELESILLGWQNTRNREKFEKLFPLSVGWTLRPGAAPEEDHYLFSISLEKVGNQMVFTDWVLGLALGFAHSSEMQRIPHRDEILFEADLPGNRPLVFFIRGNDLFFTYDLDTAKQAVDRLTAESTTRERTDLERLFDLTPEAQPLRGAITNERKEIFRSWERVAVRVEDPEALRAMTDALRGATLSGNLSGDGKLVGHVDLLCPDAAWAGANAERALRAFQDGLDYEKLRLDSEVKIDGEWIRIDFSLEGFLELLDHLSSTSGSGIIVIPPE